MYSGPRFDQSFHFNACRLVEMSGAEPSSDNKRKRKNADSNDSCRICHAKTSSRFKNMPYDHDFEGRVCRARLKMPKVCNKCYLSHRRWEKVHPVSNIITRSTRFILCALMHICSLNLLGSNLICPDPKLMQLFVPPPQAGALQEVCQV